MKEISYIPTKMFRGFENIGHGYGTLMAFPGGHDAGGGVIWAPDVIKDAASYGLVHGENRVLYDSKKGEFLPEGTNPMPLLKESDLKLMKEFTVSMVLRDHVSPYLDLIAECNKKVCGVIGENRILVMNQTLL